MKAEEFLELINENRLTDSQISLDVFSDKCLHSLKEALQSGKCPSGLTLDLRQNMLDAEGVEHIANALVNLYKNHGRFIKVENPKVASALAHNINQQVSAFMTINKENLDSINVDYLSEFFTNLFDNIEILCRTCPDYSYRNPDLDELLKEYFHNHYLTDEGDLPTATTTAAIAVKHAQYHSIESLLVPMSFIQAWEQALGNLQHSNAATALQQGLAAALNDLAMQVNIDIGDMPTEAELKLATELSASRVVLLQQAQRWGAKNIQPLINQAKAALLLLTEKKKISLEAVNKYCENTQDIQITDANLKRTLARISFRLFDGNDTFTETSFNNYSSTRFFKQPKDSEGNLVYALDDCVSSRAEDSDGKLVDAMDVCEPPRAEDSEGNLVDAMDVCESPQAQTPSRNYLP